MSGAVLDRPPGKPAKTHGLVPGPTAAAWRCPECGAAFLAVQRHQLFCSHPHRRAWHNRWMKRGAVLAPLQATVRITRGGSRGRKGIGRIARCDAERLLQNWKEEDSAAGRMQIDQYMEMRYRLGLVA